MPPRAKFTKEQILTTAMRFVEENGPDRLTARALGDALESSSRPIFSVFSSMEEVIGGVIDKARRLYLQYVERGLNAEKPFKGVGEQYIAFASEHPKLFAVLFMREQDNIPDVGTVLGKIDGSADRILDSIISEYGVSEMFAQKLYLHLWIYTHGIATSVATRVCRFEKEKISEMITEVFSGLFSLFKSEGNRI